VHRLHDDFNALSGVLTQAAEPSLQTTADDCFRKALLLAAASNFEVRIVETILQFAKTSSGNALVAEFVHNKGLKRQYHALFNWDVPNANQFYAFFGQAFKAYAEAQTKADPVLEETTKAFLEIGRERNRLVHQDFGNFTLEKTTAEIFALFERADQYPAALAALLSGYPS
jgi:hypothetical protein